MKNKHRKSGFTLVEIMIVVLIIGLLAAIAVPAFGRARARTRINTCINNLRQIESAKEQWAMENNQDEGAVPTQANLAPYIRGSFPTCPASGTYTINGVGTNATCSVSGHVLP